jgi:hypothetical protein
MLKWDARPLMKAITAGAVKGVEEAAAELEDVIRDDISIQGMPIDRRSYSGEPPRREFGDLMKSLHHEVIASKKPVGTWQKVGSPLPKAYDLEMGIGISGPRPFLRKNLVRYGKQIAETILSAIRGS